MHLQKLLPCMFKYKCSSVRQCPLLHGYRLISWGRVNDTLCSYHSHHVISKKLHKNWPYNSSFNNRLAGQFQLLTDSPLEPILFQSRILVNKTNDQDNNHSKKSRSKARSKQWQYKMNVSNYFPGHTPIAGDQWFCNRLGCALIHISDGSNLINEFSIHTVRQVGEKRFNKDFHWPSNITLVLCKSDKH